MGLSNGAGLSKAVADATYLTPATAAAAYAPLGSGLTNLFNSFADVDNVDATETNLISNTLAAGTLGANGDKILAYYAGKIIPDPMNADTLKVYFGGTVIFNSDDLGAISVTDWFILVEIIRVSASIVRCVVNVLMTPPASIGTQVKYTEVTGLTLANTQILKLTGQETGANVASNHITVKQSNVKKIAA